MAGYARLSNGFWQDKDILKLRRMNPSAALLYVMAISWCSDHASDGIIADDELLYVLNASDGDVADLVASGLLLRGSDEGCYMIRNYLKYQNSSRQIDESRERERVKKRRQREARQDIANVPDVSPKDIANVPDVSPKDDANVPDVSLGDIASVPDTSFNQEPRTKKIYLLTPLPPPRSGFRPAARPHRGLLPAEPLRRENQPDAHAARDRLAEDRQGRRRRRPGHVPRGPRPSLLRGDRTPVRQDLRPVHLGRALHAPMGQATGGDEAQGVAEKPGTAGEEPIAGKPRSEHGPHMGVHDTRRTGGIPTTTRR